jgi:hypothetical protein
VRIRGLETSEMTCVYDKENIQITNKPPRKGKHGKSQRLGLREKVCQQFSSEVNENEE